MGENQEGTQSHQGGNHWDAGKFGKLQQLTVSISLDDTATDVENRAGSFRNHLHCRRDLTVVRIRRWLIPRHVELRWEGVFHRRILDILRDIHQDRTRTASRRQVERRRNRLWNLIRIRDDEVVLGNRHRHTANICFLEGIGAQEVRAHLASNGHDWNRVQVGIRNWRN